ncbi:MAG: TonB-dependent receptor, partial [Saprospiraceae bacterium]|nr:TonB-dependent receptor [Saprospiraceae bacterium]
MLRPLLAFLLLLGSYLCLHSQVNDLSNTSAGQIQYTLTGAIIDGLSSQPIEFATVSVLNLTDSTLITGTSTDKEGVFSIKTTTLKVFLKIEFISYETVFADKFESTATGNIVNFGTISILPNVSLLEGVEVKTEKSTLMMNLDRKVFHVGKDLVSSGGTAEDILRNVPGIWVDIDGKVTLRSIGNVRILLDGQPNLFIGQSNSSGLRQIPASHIEKIEIISNPSARYEAEGLAGIINIVLKKKGKEGLNGSFNSNIGLPENLGVGVNLNYKNEKVNLFGSTNAWTITKNGNAYYRNRFFSENRADSIYFSDLDRTHSYNVQPLGLRLGADYFLNKKNTLTGAFSIRNGKSVSNADLTYTDSYRSRANIFLITKRSEEENGTDINLNGFLRHRITFNNRDQSLTTDFSYESDRDTKNSNYVEHYFDGNLNSIDSADYLQRVRNHSNYEQAIVKSDFMSPLPGNANFESGFQSSFRRITDDYEVAEMINNVMEVDSNFTNDFEYREVINALYADFGKKIRQFSFQIGLRAEYSNVTSGLGKGSPPKVNDYLDLFPSTFIGYDFKSNNGIQLSYSRRIVRPTFLDLTPFFTLRDRRNIWRGNPDILPEYIHAFELGYINYWERGTFSVIGYFHRTKNVIKRLQRVDPLFPGSTITQAENLDFKRNFGLETVYTLTLLDWLKFNGDVNLFHTYS